MPFLMSSAVCAVLQLTSLGPVENDAELGNRAGNKPSLEMLLDFAILTFVIHSNRDMSCADLPPARI